MVGHLFDGVKDDFYDLVHSFGSWRFWQSLGYTFVGLLIFSAGVNAILIPHNLMASGAMGIALLIYYVAHAPSVAVIYWLLNVPILLVGWRAMSLKYVVLAMVGVLLSGVTLEMTAGVRLPITDPLMASVIAGVLTGCGVGLYLRQGGSAGGIDVLAAVLRRKYGLPMGTTFILVNSAIFSLGGLVHHSIDRAFYTAVAMYVHSLMVERMQTGFSPRKAAWIVTCEPDEIAAQVIRRLNRGVTFLHGSGGMSKKPVRVVFTVVNLIELARLKEIIFHIDPKAFMAVNDTNEVIGYRFFTWADAGFETKHSAGSPAAMARARSNTARQRPLGV